MISRIIKVEVRVISRSRRLRLITLTETLIILDITKTESNNCFTITAEILVRSLANFYRQYADRHMNLKFVRRVSEIRPFVIVKHKLTSVFHASVLLLTMNFVITLSK